MGHPRAGPAGRARAASGHLVSDGCCRATLRVFPPERARRRARERRAVARSESPSPAARAQRAVTRRALGAGARASCAFSPVESPAPRVAAERERVVKSARRSRDTPRAGFHARARRGRQQDRAGQAQEGPDERVDGPLRLRGEDSRRYVGLFRDRGLRHEF